MDTIVENKDREVGGYQKVATGNVDNSGGVLFATATAGEEGSKGTLPRRPSEGKCKSLMCMICFF